MRCGQYVAPKESFRSWGCIEINQQLMPHWRKTNERGLWIQSVRNIQLQPEKENHHTEKLQMKPERKSKSEAGEG